MSDRPASRRSGTSHPHQIPVCACQWGPTAHCHHGDHDRCHGPAHEVEDSETHLTYADDTCVMSGGRPIPVWLADRTCRWTCACDCHTAAPAVTAELTQFALF